MKLKAKIWLLLAALLGIVIGIDLVIGYRMLERETRAEMEYDAKTIYGFMMATRRIYQQQFIASGLQVNDATIGFLPAHSFLRISRDFANWNKNGIIFNNVSDRPRNPANQADRFETEAIQWFRSNPAATERMREIVTDRGVGYLLFTAPIRVEPYCLKCHGEVESAPAGIRQRYDSAYGYHTGDMRGVVSIRIPTEKFHERVLRIWFNQLVKNLVGYALVLLALGLILDWLVIRRLTRVHAGTQQIAAGDYGTRVHFERILGGRDEIVDLADTFNRMAEGVQSRDRDLVKLTQAVEQSPAHILITDLEGRIEYVNAACARDTGYARNELIGANPRVLKSGKTQQSAYRELWAALTRGDQWEGELVNQRKGGEEYIAWAIIAPVRDANGKVSHYLAVMQDITDKKRAEAEIHNLAYYDPLTNLPNRRLLLDRLGQALLASKRRMTHGAILILDIDHFKNLNDSRGHDVGDRLIQDVAIRLVESVRQEDTVARPGGDEFAVIIEGLSENEATAALEAESIAEKARRDIGRSYTLDSSGMPYEISASMGITLFQGTEVGVDTLMKQADVALYQAKSAGRDRLRFFNQAMQAAVDVRATLENALRHAVENDELRLFYQAQVDADHRVVGAEALLRWLHPSQGMISPGYFIPLAEETGLILPIGDWVIAQACAQLRAWSEDPATRDLQLAINISGHQIRQPDFTRQVARRIVDSGIEPSRLKLELTESVVLDNVDEVIQRMQELKALGVAFSLDDFGTGYSSLSYLKRLPLDQVKIDQSFVRDLTDDSNDATIVRAILAMSQSLGLEAIAEGVETTTQCDFLTTCGCRAFQGYLFGRPMPIQDWLERYHARTAHPGASGQA
jgi:diguanylate cyclase (GGDEF)-like protein/PAS domain S-box-containing protein